MCDVRVFLTFTSLNLVLLWKKTGITDLSQKKADITGLAQEKKLELLT
jgi:hypothetical protein